MAGLTGKECIIGDVWQRLISGSGGAAKNTLTDLYSYFTENYLK